MQVPYVEDCKRRCVRNDVEGGCGGEWFREHVEPSVFATRLAKAGWDTGYFGKYLNTYGEEPDGLSHVPPGWATWLGLQGNSRYYNYTLSANGRAAKLKDTVQYFTLIFHLNGQAL